MAEPIASGTLQKTPLPHLLIYLDQRALSGTLALWPDPDEGQDQGQDRILFLKGRPVAGRLLSPGSTLKDGLLRLFARKSAPYAFYEDNLLGDDRQSGRLDPMALITESLRASARDDVVDGVIERFGDAKLRMQPKVDLARFGFDGPEKGFIELLRAEPAGLDALVAGSGMPPDRGRRFVYLLMIAQAVVPYAGPKDRRRTTTERLTDEIEVPAAAPTPQPVIESPAPQPSVKASRKPAPAQTAAAPATDTSLPPAATVTSLSPEANSSAPPPAAKGSMGDSELGTLNNIPPPPPQLSGDKLELWQSISMKGRLIENQNYYEMLGVARDAEPDDVRQTFFAFAKKWHPDRLPPEFAPIKGFAETIFGYVSEAYHTLSNEEERKAYLKSVKEGGGTPATEKLMEAILDSAMKYERVLVLSRQHQYQDALDELKSIMKITKDEPDYYAMYAWLLMRLHQQDDGPVNEMLESVETALKLFENHEKANLYKAQILQRMGRGNEAMRFFRKVVEINPRNTDAQREVRIATMRGKEKKTDDGPFGLGKLFKKK